MDWSAVLLGLQGLIALLAIVTHRAMGAFASTPCAGTVVSKMEGAAETELSKWLRYEATVLAASIPNVASTPGYLVIARAVLLAFAQMPPYVPGAPAAGVVGVVTATAAPAGS